MFNDIENFLLKIEQNKGKTIDDELINESQNILKNLKEEFRKNVMDEFSYYLEESYDSKSTREFIKNVTSKVKFVDEFAYRKGSFIETYWDKLPEIIDILKNYVNELEAQEAEEQQNNEQTEEGESNND